MIGNSECVKAEGGHKSCICSKNRCIKLKNNCWDRRGGKDIYIDIRSFWVLYLEILFLQS